MKILQYPDKLLSKKSMSLSKGDYMDFLPTFKKYVENIKSKAIGLACVQTGMPVSIIWIKNFGFLINAKIIESSEDKIGSIESCLSVLREDDNTKYRLYGVVRSKWIKVLYRDENFKICKHKFENELAIVTAHEIDHTNGQCLPQYAQYEMPNEELTENEPN